MLVVESVHLLYDGCYTLDKGFLVYGKAKYYGEPYNAALKPLLVITNKEKILVDTGIGELPEKYRKFYPVKRGSGDSLRERLSKHGLEPKDVDVVINTHLHFDHSGNNKLFKNSRFLVQRSELKYAYSPHRFQKAPYIQETFDSVDYIEVEGRCEVNDGVVLIPTPGHTPGHQSVIVEAKDKKIVYCGDAIMLRENLERRNIPGVLHNPVQALESIDKLRNIKNAHYIFSHDNEQLVI